MTADGVIALLALAPHPEGGYYRETFREPSEGRGHGTAIYYLLKAGERSHYAASWIMPRRPGSAQNLA